MPAPSWPLKKELLGESGSIKHPGTSSPCRSNESGRGISRAAHGRGKSMSNSATSASGLHQAEATAHQQAQSGSVVEAVTAHARRSSAAHPHSSAVFQKGRFRRLSCEIPGVQRPPSPRSLACRRPGNNVPLPPRPARTPLAFIFWSSALPIHSAVLPRCEAADQAPRRVGRTGHTLRSADPDAVGRSPGFAISAFTAGCLVCRASISRSCRRALSRQTSTAATERFTIFAICSTEISSISRSTKTVRHIGSKLRRPCSNTPVARSGE